MHYAPYWENSVHLIESTGAPSTGGLLCIKVRESPIGEIRLGAPVRHDEGEDPAQADVEE
jgi:hypothetical protein